MDFCCAVAAGGFGYLLRFGEGDQAPRPDAVLAVALPLIWVAWVAAARAYDARFFGAGTEEYRRIIDAGLSLTATVAVVSYATKAEVARGFVVVTLPAVTLLSLFARRHLRKFLWRRRAQGECLRRTVVVGHREAVTELVRELDRGRAHGMQIVAACLPGDHTGPARGAGVPRTGVTGVPAGLDPDGVSTVPMRVVPYGDGADILGTVPVEGRLGDVADVVRRSNADTVAVLACPELAGVELRRLAWKLEKTHTELLVASALLDIAGPRTSIRPVAGLPLLHVEHPELAGTRRLLKAIFDRTAAAVALVLLAPLWALTALLVRLDDPGPALFSQERIGRDGRRFRMLKFRTMVVDAERRRSDIAVVATDAVSTGNAVLFKIKNDPRITRLGAWLRRFSIDELPQLVNVLRGEMSLVGPRPPLPQEVDQYGQDVYRRLAVLPGMTGLWQVSGRSDLSWDETVRLDLRYIENWSLVLDMQILWKTFAAVFRGQGAY
ncbi:sugar transferase [Spirillospora sp. NPDC047279]|uniref:sugar transferase n=1 Tax=Spirillospora sp. NPDC047279 TaxID=3155478 RepID=UPI0034012DBF